MGELRPDNKKEILTEDIPTQLFMGECLTHNIVSKHYESVCCNSFYFPAAFLLLYYSNNNSNSKPELE